MQTLANIESGEGLLDDFAPSDLVVVSSCHNATIRIAGPKAAKSIIEGCSDLVVSLETELISGMLELINCERVTVTATASIPTIQVERSSGVGLTLPAAWGTDGTKATVITSEATSVTLSTADSADGPFSITDTVEPGVQFMTRRGAETGAFETAQLIREGSGYATTVADKEAHDARDARNLELLGEAINKTIEERQAAATTYGSHEPDEDGDSIQRDPHPRGMLSGIRAFNRAVLAPTETVFSAGPGGVASAGSSSHGHSNPDEITEYEDTPEEIAAKVAEVAALVRAAAGAVVAFTGAGISTSADIPDYRGPKGVWTLRDQGKRAKLKAFATAAPTACHMGLVQMVADGSLAHVVSTNVDGLHLRSGLTPETLSELHGNAYLEKCSDANCGAKFLRPFDCTKNGLRTDHQTGRDCETCGAPLLDSIVHFGESLPDDQYNQAEAAARDANLAIVLGTSMKVSPACNLPELSYRLGKGHLVICNLQRTPYDKYASVRLFCKTDEFMERLAAELAFDIPAWQSDEIADAHTN